MKLTTQLLSEEEKQLIHKQSLKILSNVGVSFLGEKSLPLLSTRGVKVDDRGIAYIPIELIEETLALAPRCFSLGARNKIYDLHLPSRTTRYGMDGTGAFMNDFVTGKRRYGIKKDIINALRVFQFADLGFMAWPPICASDTPAPSRPLHEFFTMIKSTSKHGQHELHTIEQTEYLIEGLEIVAGSSKKLQESNLFSLIYCPVAPLIHDGAMLDAYIELGQSGIPIMVMPMPVIGTTGPASLYSNIALANAETLSSILIFQLAHPGRPIIYSSATGSIDFKTGTYLAGTIEMALQSAALGQMGKYYGFPVASAGMTTDAKDIGADAILEKVVTTLPAVQVGADIIIGFGEVESDQTLALEQILIDNEIAHLCEYLVKGVEITPEKDLYDDIQRIGPGGHFLGSKQTRAAAINREFYRREFANYSTYESWTNLGKPSMYSKAREKVEEVLSGSLVDPLPDEISLQLDDILRRADKVLTR